MIFGRDLRQEIVWLAVILLRQMTHKMAKDCPNCRTLTEILRWTEKELRAARLELEVAKKKLEQIKTVSESAAKTGARVMSEPAGVPRGEWSYALGQNQLGNRILKILGMRPHKPGRATGRRLFKQLFR